MLVVIHIWKTTVNILSKLKNSKELDVEAFNFMEDYKFYS